MDCCKCYGVEDVVLAAGSLIQYIWALAADWLHDEECGWELNHQVTLEMFEKNVFFEKMRKKTAKCFSRILSNLIFFSDFTVYFVSVFVLNLLCITKNPKNL